MFFRNPCFPGGQLKIQAIIFIDAKNSPVHLPIICEDLPVKRSPDVLESLRRRLQTCPLSRKLKTSESQRSLFVKVQKMYQCGIGKLSGTDCGSVTVKDTVINEYQALSDCQRDITGHLEMLKMRGEDVLSEKELILLRAGENILISLTSVIEGMFMVDLNLY